MPYIPRNKTVAQPLPPKNVTLKWTLVEPKITRISPFGEVDIAFPGAKLMRLSNLTVINDKILKIEILPVNPDMKINLNKLTWNATEMKSNVLTLKLNFEFPDIVSRQGSNKDKLKITFLSNDTLLDVGKGYYIRKD